jgi:hypothetical protein
MFGGKPKPVEQTTAKDIWCAAFFGSLIGSVIFVGSFFSKQPEWFLWVVRCFCAVWLIGWWRSVFRWRRHLAEYQRQKCNH